MLSLLGWSIFISFLHGLFPNHWLPIIAIGKLSDWSNKKALKVTALLGGIHIFSTLLLGLVLFYLGNQAAENLLDFELITSIGFIVFGLIYGLLPQHKHQSKGAKKISLGYLAFSMILSPCIEIIPFYFSLGEFGWGAYIMVSLIYTLFSLMGILFMAYFGLKAAEKLNENFLLKHEKLIISGIFILVGIVNFFIE